MTVIFRISHGVRGDRHGSGPALRRDHLDDMLSLADGKTYSSKASYYRSLKQQGLEIDDRPRVRDVNRPDHDTSGLRDDIGRAIKQEVPENYEKSIEKIIPELDT